MITNKNNLIFICILCIIGLYIIFNCNIIKLSGGNQIGEVKRKISKMEENIKTNLKEATYDVDKYYYNKDIQAIIKNNLLKFKSFASFDKFNEVFNNKYKKNSRLTDDELLVGLIVKLINFRHYYVMQHFILKILLHLSNANSPRYIYGGNINTQLDILNNKDFYKYYFNITQPEENFKLLSNSKYSYNKLIIFNQQNLELNNVLKYPSCWGPSPTDNPDWENTNKFLDQVCLYLNRYVDFNKGIKMSNELLFSLEIIKEMIGTDKSNQDKFTILRNLMLKQLVDFTGNNSYTLKDILNNESKIEDKDIQNMLRLKNNKDIFKNILEYANASLNKNKLRTYLEIPSSVSIPTRLSTNINKFENYVKYNKIYTKIILTTQLETSIKTYLTQDDHSYDIKDNDIIFDNIFNKLKNKSQIEEEPHIYNYLHFIYNNDLSNEGMNEVKNKIEPNDLSDDKKQIINKVINKDKKIDNDSDKKKYYDYINNSETYDLITNIINSKHHKLTPTSSNQANKLSFKVDILTQKKLEELFFNYVKDSKLTVYYKTEYPQYFNTYKTNNTDVGFELEFELISGENKLNITWPSYDKLPLKLHYFYIDNILFFINSMKEKTVQGQPTKPTTVINVNYIYYEENLIEYLERSSLDNHELTKKFVTNSSDLKETPSITSVINHLEVIPKDSELSDKRIKAINKLDELYKSSLVGGAIIKKEPNYLINNMYKRLAKYDETQKKYTINITDLKGLQTQTPQGQWRPWNFLEENTYNNKIKFKFEGDKINLMENLIEKITDYSIFNTENDYLIEVSKNPKLYNENYDILYESYDDKIINSYKYTDENILITGIKRLHDGFEFHITNIYQKIKPEYLRGNLSSIKNNKFILDEEIYTINEQLRDNSMEILDKINLTSRQIQNNKKKEYYNTKLESYKKSPINFINNNDTSISYNDLTISSYTVIESQEIENKLEEFTGGQIDIMNIKIGFMKEINKDLQKYYKPKVIKRFDGSDESISEDKIVIELKKWEDRIPNKFAMNDAVKFKLINLEYIKKHLIDLIKEKLTNELLKISNKITDTTNKWYTNVRLTIERLFIFIDNIQTSLYKSISLKNPSYFNYNNFKKELNKKQIKLSFEYDTDLLNKLFNNILPIPPKNTDILSDKLLNSLLFDTTNIVKKLKDLKDEINIDFKNKLLGREIITDEIVRTLINIRESPIYRGLSGNEDENNNLITQYKPYVLKSVILDKPMMKVFKIRDSGNTVQHTLMLKDISRIPILTPTSSPITGGNNMEYVCINNDCDKLVKKLDFVNLKNNKNFKLEIDENQPVKINIKPYILKLFDIDISREAQILSSFEWRELGFSNKKIELINNLVLEKFPNFLKKEQKNIPPLENNKWKGKSILKKEVGIIKNTTYSTSLTTSLTLKIVKFYEFLQKQRLKLINQLFNKLGINRQSFENLGSNMFIPPAAQAIGFSASFYPLKHTNNMSIINLKRDSENEIKSSLKDKFKTYFVDKSGYNIRTYPYRTDGTSNMSHSMMYFKHFVNDNYDKLINNGTIYVQDFVDIFKQTNIIPVDSIISNSIDTILQQRTVGGTTLPNLNNDVICKIYKSLKEKFIKKDDDILFLDSADTFYKDNKKLELNLLYTINTELMELSFESEVTIKNIKNIIKKHINLNNINLDDCN